MDREAYERALARTIQDLIELAGEYGRAEYPDDDVRRRVAELGHLRGSLGLLVDDLLGHRTIELAAARSAAAAAGPVP